MQFVGSVSLLLTRLSTGEEYLRGNCLIYSRGENACVFIDHRERESGIRVGTKLFHFEMLAVIHEHKEHIGQFIFEVIFEFKQLFSILKQLNEF